MLSDIYFSSSTKQYNWYLFANCGVKVIQKGDYFTTVMVLFSPGAVSTVHCSVCVNPA